MNRREFTGHLAKGAVVLSLAGTTLELSGCNVITDISNWIPTGEAALNSILTILSANGILIPPGTTAIVQLIEAGFNALLAAIKEYQSTNPPPAGVLAKIQAILKDITDQFAAFVKSLSGTASKILAIVVSLAQVIISTIGGFVNQLPKSAALMASFSESAKQAGIVVVPVHRTRRAFKKAINSELDAAKTQGVTVPQAAYLPLSFFEHM